MVLSTQLLSRVHVLIPHSSYVVHLDGRGKPGDMWRLGMTWRRIDIWRVVSDEAGRIAVGLGWAGMTTNGRLGCVAPLPGQQVYVWVSQGACADVSAVLQQWYTTVEFDTWYQNDENVVVIYVVLFNGVWRQYLGHCFDVKLDCWLRLWRDPAFTKIWVQLNVKKMNWVLSLNCDNWY